MLKFHTQGLPGLHKDILKSLDVQKNPEKIKRNGCYKDEILAQYLMSEEFY